MEYVFEHKPKGSLIGDGDYAFRHYGIELAKYSINEVLTYCESDPDNPTEIVETKTATLLFTAATDYVLPDEITVTGAEYSWDEETGTLVLSNPTADVYITIVAVPDRIKLATPTNVSLTGTIVATDPVENAEMYVVVDAGGYTVGSYSPPAYEYEEQGSTVIIRNAPYSEEGSTVVIGDN